MTAVLTPPAKRLVQARSRRVEKTVEQKRLWRVQVIWGLLFFNVLSFADQPIVLPIPHFLGQIMTQGGLILALLMALTVNPRIRARPNIFLILYSVLATTTLMMSVRFIGLGTTYRAFRLVEFVVVLWLLTPWWGRRDLLFLKTQLRFLIAILISLVLGLAISPGKAYVFNAGARRLGRRSGRCRQLKSATMSQN